MSNNSPDVKNLVTYDVAGQTVFPHCDVRYPETGGLPTQFTDTGKASVIIWDKDHNKFKRLEFNLSDGWHDGPDGIPAS